MAEGNKTLTPKNQDTALKDNDTKDKDAVLPPDADDLRRGAVTPAPLKLPPPPPANPATSRQKVVLFLALVLMTLLMLWLAKWAVAQVDGLSQKVNRVQWQAPAGFTLKPGPPTFWYDSAQSQLVHIGAIDQKTKLELLSLVSTPADQQPSDEIKGYWAAINQLAFTSNDQLGGLRIGILILGGLAGMLGVQLRSLVNFVGHACYTNNLDLVIWWPYYALRPFIGFVLGVIIVVIVQAGFFVAGQGEASGTLWWAGIAFLAGFGEQEFTQRLRMLTKTLFGEEAKPPVNTELREKRQ